MANVVIGCKLPNGIILEHPMKPDMTVSIAGLNSAVIIGADHATTAVEEEFWEQWFAVHKEFPAVKSGALFVAKSANDAKAIARENKERKTGFEKLNPADKKHGVKPAKNDD